MVNWLDGNSSMLKISKCPKKNISKYKPVLDPRILADQRQQKFVSDTSTDRHPAQCSSKTVIWREVWALDDD